MEKDIGKNYLIVLKNESTVSYIVEDVYKTTTDTNNIYFKNDAGVLVAVVAKDSFSLIREVEKGAFDNIVI